jgi:hypothetical protein
MQWHPIFAHLLRAVLDQYYEVRTTVPVGDLPRSADIVLLHRASTGTPPFQGLWRWLTPWNVVEFKGVNASARLGDLDSLIELGMGVHRRLNELEVKEDRPEIERDGMSWWYIVPHLGRRFRRDAGALLGQPLEGLAPGVWRARLLQRGLMLVSGDDVEVDRDSLPMHALLGVPEPARPTAAQILGGDASLLAAFGGWVSLYEPVLWQEIVAMAAQRGENLTPDVSPFVKYLGLPELLRQIGPRRLLEELGVEGILSELTPEERAEMLRRLQQSQPTPPGTGDPAHGGQT